MLKFEEHVIALFKSHQIEFQFAEKQHFLTSRGLNIAFVPACSLPGSPFEASVPATKGFTLRLWEDVFRQHREVVESRILSALGISQRLHGRDTKVADISPALLTGFLARNHLNAPVRAKYRYGLFLGPQLVAVAAFGRSCPVQYQGATYRSHELIRYGSLLNHTVVGGLGKLLRHFERTVHPQHLMTSVDREWSAGKSYLNLGFTVAGVSPPQEFWLAPDRCKRYYPKELTGKAPATLAQQGWRKIKNLGNLRLIRLVHSL